MWFEGDPGTLTLDDLRPDGSDARDDGADIQAFNLGAGYSGEQPTTFDGLFGFNGTNLDGLIYYLGAWSSTSCAEDEDTTDQAVPFCQHIPAP